MDKDSYLNDVRQGLQDSVDFFGSQDKFTREKWVVSEFLTNLSIPFFEEDIIPGSDPPDIIFKDANFEVKEILDKGRRRHEEYKAALARAYTETDPAALTEEYLPRSISIDEVSSLVLAQAADLAKNKYPLQVRREMDLICYVNLKHVIKTVGTPFPDACEFGKLGFRSICFLHHQTSGILWVDQGALSFLGLQQGVCDRPCR